MRGLRYIFHNLRHIPISMLVVSLLGIMVLIMPFAFHEELGSEDYIYPKLFISVTAVFFAILSILSGCRDISQNKLVASFPFAKELYTKSVPIFIVMSTLIANLILVGAYFIFLGNLDVESVHFSDTLVCAGITSGTFLLCSPLLVKFSGGGVLMCVYIPAIPSVGMVIFTGARSDGFELPIWVSIEIFISAIIIGTVWTFIISKVLYHRRKVKQQTTMCIYTLDK